jgi:hypothetical protein
MAPLAKVVLVALGSVTAVSAWGSLGHATVAYVAQNYVTSETAAW